jgi:ferredoxin-NADP reductase
MRWQLGEVVELTMETEKVSTLAFRLPDWPGHQAGQHVDIRLTAEDGYQAQRSYSIASPPEDARVALTVERLDDGEVSPYLVGEVVVGDRLELRGPIGGYFVWDAARESGRPVLLVGGGSGVVPLMAMIRHRQASGSRTPMRLLYSSRSLQDMIYRRELDDLAVADEGLGIHHTLTRSQPPGWRGYGRRIDKEMLAEISWPARERPAVFVCGPTSFVETAAVLLLELGYDAGWIKTERFGATGGPA